MATPRVSDNPATQRNYAAQLTLGAALAQAVRGLWSATSPMSSADALRSFGSGARVLVDQFAAAGSVMAGDSYRTARLDAGVTAPLTLPRIAAPAPGKVAKELDWMERQRQEIEARLEQDLAEIEAEILAEAVAAFEKVVADEARQFTVAAVEGDEKAIGFRRVARPDACAWCLALAIRKTTRRGLAAEQRGPGSFGGDKHWGVFKSRASAGQLPEGADQVNRFHFNCHCTVEPIFDASFVPPSWLLAADELYADSDDFNDFRRRLNAQRGGVTPTSPAPVLPLPTARPEQASALADLLASIDAAMRVA